MLQVLFTKSVEPFSIIFPRFERTNLQDRTYGLYFCTTDIQKMYWKLLENRCLICDESESFSFKTFAQLKDHVRREHEMFYCPLCVEHLKIFTFERRTYNRQELGMHRRKGDPDNTSHRGHPLCQFCDTRCIDLFHLTMMMVWRYGVVLDLWITTICTGTYVVTTCSAITAMRTVNTSTTTPWTISSNTFAKSISSAKRASVVRYHSLPSFVPTSTSRDT